MSRFQKIFLILPLLALILVDCGIAHAKPKYLFKVATLAPDGSVWMKRFNEFVDEISEKSNGEIGFRIYPGGVMGDDKSMYRKMRVGQLQGGGFTMTGIGDVVPEYRIMGIPFLFRSYEEVDAVRQQLWPDFKKAFEKKGLALIAFSEVGFIYPMSSYSIATVEDLKKCKCWVPEGDPLSLAYLNTIGITPIQLTIADVLSSLQTGMVDTVFNGFYGAIVLQWFTKTNYISDTPFGYAYGAFLLDLKQFSKLPPDYQSLIESTAQKHFTVLLEDTRKSNKESLAVLEQNGLKLVEPNPNDLKELHKYRDMMVEKVLGGDIPKDMYDKLVQALKEVRSHSNH